jgi:hypothetical protein
MSMNLELGPKNADQRNRSPFRGLAIAFSGSFRGSTHQELKELVVSLGGKATGKLEPGLTHVVSTKASLEKAIKSKAVQYALGQQKPIVGIEWLHACKKERKVLHTQEYELILQASSNAEKRTEAVKTAYTPTKPSPKLQAMIPAPSPSAGTLTTVLMFHSAMELVLMESMGVKGLTERKLEEVRYFLGDDPQLMQLFLTTKNEIRAGLHDEFQM